MSISKLKGEKLSFKTPAKSIHDAGCHNINTPCNDILEDLNYLVED